MVFDIGRMALETGIGFGVGMLSGILGIGGGAVLVPAVVFLLAVDQHTAQGVSLAVVVPTALAGAITHYRQGFVASRTAAIIGLASIVFAVLGANVAGMLDEVWLSRFFGALILVLGIRMIVMR